MDASTGANGSANTAAPAGAHPWARDAAWAGLNEAERATVAENFRLATGGAAPHHAWQLMADLADAAGGPPVDAGEDPAAAAGEARVAAALEAAMALAPRDPLEGMLVAQMAAVHAAAMRALIRAGECTRYPQIEALYVRQAARLLNLFVRQMEALDRRARRRGSTVEGAQGANGASRDKEHAAEAGAIEGDADGLEILARSVAACQADIAAHRRERERAAGEKATHDPSGVEGREPGTGFGRDP